MRKGYKMAIADSLKADAKEWGGKPIKYIEVPEKMRLTSKERRLDSARLRARYTKNIVWRGGIGSLS